MQVDALAVALRPRPMFEAADLGVRLLQAHARSVWRCHAPLWAATTLVAASTFEIAAWLPWLLLFMAKPWLDRTLLFVLSRAVFGEATRWSDLWAVRWPVWAGQWLDTFTLRRLSPWRTYLQPALQLEGQRGAAGRDRRRQLLRGKRGAVVAMGFAFGAVETSFMIGLCALVAWMTPGEHPFGFFTWLSGDGGVWLNLGSVLLYAVVTLFVEPCFVAAGFAMYLNRRVELEAWDIEQEFRRAFAAW